MALSSVERAGGRSIQLPRFTIRRRAQEISRTVSFEEIIAREPSVMDRVRSAAATGDSRNIEEAKAAARVKGKLPGLLASIVLFNAER